MSLDKLYSFSSVNRGGDRPCSTPELGDSDLFSSEVDGPFAVIIPDPFVAGLSLS